MCAIQIVIIVLLGVFKIIGKEFKVRDSFKIFCLFSCFVCFTEKSYNNIVRKSRKYALKPIIRWLMLSERRERFRCVKDGDVCRVACVKLADFGFTHGFFSRQSIF